ncbi:MAG: putative lipid II flippase FtsW [Christensenellales bacterium]|jgi:cell division protein FtsW
MTQTGVQKNRSANTRKAGEAAAGRAQKMSYAKQLKKMRSMDFTILITVLILSLFGLTMLYSASYYLANLKYGDDMYFLKSQLQGFVLGLIVMFIMINFNYRVLEKFRWVILGIAVALLVAVLLTGDTKNEATRWLNIAGISVQPSEIAKFAVILWMASYMTRRQKVIQQFKYGVIPNLLVLGVVCGLIILQPNLSTVISICALGFVLMYAGGVKMRQLIPVLLLAVVAVVALMFAAPYRRQRYTVFLDPWADPLGDGYQLIQSLYAIGAGGIFGTGFGTSRQKLLFLPYGESDFIFAVITEELGLVGVLVLIALFVVLIWRGIRVAITAQDQFGALLAAGVVGIIGVQAAIHIAVATGSIPPTGVSLPFISYGSSSLVIFMASIGLLLNISKYCRE